MPSSSLSRSRHRIPTLDRFVAVLLGVAYVAILMATDQMGFTRDESFYFHAAYEYSGWFEALGQAWRDGDLGSAFTQEVIDRHWAYNPEHPVLVKTLFALSHMLFDEQLGWMSPSLAMRFPALVFAGLLLTMLYTFTYEVTGRRYAALMATCSFAVLPRWFFHAHLTCFDVPMVTIWFAIVYAYWKSFDSTKWAWATGLLWGIGLITKLNAFFIPIVFLAHWGVMSAMRMRVRGTRIVSPPVPLALFTMALLGPLVFYAGWPRHWFDTFDRIAWYLNFHLQHEHYFVWYFGQPLFEPPFPVSYPFVMTLTTTPLPFLAAFLIGSVALLVPWVRRIVGGQSERGDRYGTGILIAMNIIVPFLIIARSSTPVFGGIKHWFTALPYMAIVAAAGLTWVVDQFVAQRRSAGLPLKTLLALLILGPAIAATMRSHPYGTAYYNATTGGVTGAADMQAMRQFWGYAARGGLEYLNQNAPLGASVHFHNSTSWSIDMYKRDGLLREDIRVAWSMRSADYVMFHHQKSFASFEGEVWQRFGFAPLFVADVSGVPMLSIYGHAAEQSVDDSRPGLDDDDDRDPEANQDAQAGGDAAAERDAQADGERGAEADESGVGALLDTNDDDGASAIQRRSRRGPQLRPVSSDSLRLRTGVPTRPLERADVPSSAATP
ncbi:MAG: 4-amino-4-deoxy-L-arabinose transferase-like glycosyltransferase [Bradymonadia bacterium]|jgi:4-amino-4-deoxy-L-arabinose transferase-like glycosyltransferase